MRRTILCLLIALSFSVLSPLDIQAKSEKEYQAEIQLLQKRNTELENKLEQASKTIELLQQQLVKMTENEKERVQEVEETRAAMKQVKSQLTDLLEQQTQSGAKPSKEIEQQLTQSMQQARKLKEELESLKKSQEKPPKKDASVDTSAAAKELELARAQLEQERQQFKANLMLLQQRDAELKAANTKLQEFTAQKNPQSDRRVAELESTLATVNAKLIQLSQQNTQLQAELQQSQSAGQNTSQKDAEIKRLEGELRTAADYINSRDAENATLRDAEAKLTQRSGTLQEQEQQIAQLQTELTTLKQENATLRDAEAKLMQSSGTLQEKEQQITQLQTELTTLQTQLQNAEQQGTQAQGEFTSVQARLNDAEQQSMQLKNDVSSLQAKLSDAEQQNTKFMGQIAALELSLKNQASVPDEAKNRIRELTLELQDAKTQVDKQHRMEQDYPKIEREAAALREQVALLTRENAEYERLRTQLKTTEDTLAQAKREQDAVLEQSKRELDAVASTNLDLKKQLENTTSSCTAQSQQFQDISARNRDLEEKYTKGIQELAFKEQLIQTLATEKAMIEKTIDEKGSPFEELKAKLQQADTRNAELQRQLKDLNAAQVLKIGTQQETAPLQQQFAQERMLRQKAEVELLAVRQQTQQLQQQVASLSAGQSRPIVPPLSSPLGNRGLPGNSAATWFPQELGQNAPGNALTILAWSPDRSKIAYQEFGSQKERVLIFNTRTQQTMNITELPGKSTATNIARFAWAFDNEHFLLATGAPERYVLYVGNSAGLLGKPMQIQDKQVCFAWSPVQLQFAYFSGSNLIVQRLNGETLPMQIGNAPGADGTSLQWSPDGTRLAFSCKREANFDIFTLTLTGAKPLLQTLVASPADDIQPSWSADGRNVAFYVRAEHYDTKIAVTPADRSRAPYIVAHNVSAASMSGPFWSSKTGILYVGADSPVPSQNLIYQIDIASGKRSSVPMSAVLTMNE